MGDYANLQATVDAIGGKASKSEVKRLASIVCALADEVFPGKCRTHPRYLARRQPKSSCKHCWITWELKQFRAV